MKQTISLNTRVTRSRFALSIPSAHMLFVLTGPKWSDVKPSNNICRTETQRNWSTYLAGCATIFVTCHSNQPAIGRIIVFLEVHRRSRKHNINEMLPIEWKHFPLQILQGDEKNWKNSMDICCTISWFLEPRVEQGQCCRARCKFRGFREKVGAYVGPCIMRNARTMPREVADA